MIAPQRVASHLVGFTRQPPDSRCSGSASRGRGPIDSRGPRCARSPRLWGWATPGAPTSCWCWAAFSLPPPWCRAGGSGSQPRRAAGRIVCANTFRAAELEGERTGATFSFIHKSSWRNRIDEARQAVTGARGVRADDPLRPAPRRDSRPALDGHRFRGGHNSGPSAAPAHPGPIGPRPRQDARLTARHAAAGSRPRGPRGAGRIAGHTPCRHGLSLDTDRPWCSPPGPGDQSSRATSSARSAGSVITTTFA
jgi:Domain of unknown function (DUF932)